MTTKSFTYMCCTINDFESNWSEMCLAGQISGLPFTGEHLSSISSLPLPGIVLEWVFILRTYFIREIAKTENRKETTMETNRFSFLERKWVYVGMPQSWNDLNVERIREKWFFQFTKKCSAKFQSESLNPLLQISLSDILNWFLHNTLQRHSDITPTLKDVRARKKIVWLRKN